MGNTLGNVHPHLRPRYEWEATVRRVRFGPRSKTREIALLLAWHADKDGTSCYPGIARLAAVAECSERTVRDALDTLRGLGLLCRVEEGSKFGRPRNDASSKPYKDHYILTVPPDLADHVAMLPPDEQDLEREEKRRAARRADNERRRLKRLAAAAAMEENPSVKASANPSAQGADHGHPEPYQGKAGTVYQGKASGVTGETNDRNRGKLAPDIPETTSGNAAYQSIGPIHRPIHGMEPSDSVNPPDARAPGAEEPEQHDQQDPSIDAKVGTIALVLGDLTADETERARDLFAQGYGFRDVNAMLASARRPTPKRTTSRWSAA